MAPPGRSTGEDRRHLTPREGLRALVTGLVRPKMVRGAQLTGPELARLIEQVVTALNEREIPTAGSLVQYFNRDLVAQCRQAYLARSERRHHHLWREGRALWALSERLCWHV